MQLNNWYFYFHNKLNIYFITAYHSTLWTSIVAQNTKYKNETVQKRNTRDVLNLHVT